LLIRPYRLNLVGSGRIDLCDKVTNEERIRRGEINRLIINLPPRHLKSPTVSVAFPAFLLGLEPWHRIFAISYGNELSSKHARDFRFIVEAPLVSAGVSEHAN